MTLRIYILYVDMNNSEKAVTRCKKTYCPKFVSQLNKLTEKITKNMTRTLKGKEFAKLMKNITKKLKKNKTISKTMDKKILEDCVKVHCNPSCKDTIYQAGSQFPKSLEAEIKKKQSGDIILKILKKTRKRMFGNKKDVLVNDFHKNLPKEKVDKIKKAGAISGCTAIVL